MSPFAATPPLGGFFIAFRGRGYVIGLIAAGCLLLADWFCGVRYHDPAYYAQHGWPKLAAFSLAALIVWSLHSLGREEAIGMEGGAASRRTFFREQDSFFFIPARHWPLVLSVLGGVFWFIRG